MTSVHDRPLPGAYPPGDETAPPEPMRGTPSAARQGWSRAVLVERVPARRPVTLAAPVAALWAAVFGLLAVALPVLLGWVSTPAVDHTWTEALRACAAVWLGANLVPVTVGPVTFSLLPLGLTLVPLLLLWHSARWAVRTTRVASAREEAVLVTVTSVVYGGVAAVLAGVASTGALALPPIRAGLTAGSLAAATVVGVLLRETDLPERLARRLPDDGPAVLRAALVATLLLLAAGALLGAVGLLLGLPTAVDLTRALTAGAGPAAGPLLLLLGLGYVPVAAIWGTAFLLGPGVAVGQAAIVGPGGGAGAADLPAFPLLAALPAASPTWTWGLLVLPVAAGVVAGMLLGRTTAPVHASAGSALARAVATGLVSGLLVALACLLASGSLGTDRLGWVGPPALACGAVAAGLVGLGALAGLLVPHRRP